MNSGIYTIASLSGKMYVGSATCLRQRRNMHFSLLRSGKHHSILLQRAFNKYGPDGLIFKKLFICDRSELRFYEQRAINILKPAYNIDLNVGEEIGHKRPNVSEALKLYWSNPINKEKHIIAIREKSTTRVLSDAGR